MSRGQRRAAATRGKRADVRAPAHLATVLSAALGHHQAGRLGEAEQLYRQVLALDSRHFDSLHLLGVIAAQRGRHDLAIEQIGAAIAINALAPEAHNNLGIALRRQGRLDEAMSSYERALALKPDFAAAYSNLGNVLSDRHRLDEAMRCFLRALALKPDDAETLTNLGVALQRQSKQAEAISCYRRALAVKPDYAEAEFNLATVLKDQGRLDEAVACAERALALRSDYTDACLALGALLQDGSRFSEAALLFDREFTCHPDKYGVLLSARSCLPPISAGTAERQELRRGLLETLRHPPEPLGTIDNPVKEFCRRFFYLAYHGEDDRPLMEAACRLFRRVSPMLNFVAPALASGQPRRRAPGDRIRVGFLSQYLCEHTIGKLTQGFIKEIDRERFHVVAIHAPGTKSDATSAAIDATADEVLVLGEGLAGAQRAVAELQLDVLHYPDIGMSHFTYWLAFARLALVQTVGWGHPTTTGLDSIDYFLSFDAAEPGGAEAHYSETLVPLGRPPAYYEPFFVPTDMRSRAELGLPEHGTLYVCPQALFKFHSDFDAVLADILAQDPTGWIVVLDGPQPAWKDALRERWSRTHPILAMRVWFLPWQPLDSFMMLLAHADVLLDPAHFGSGNTFYESMIFGVPSITWPGLFMRGRIVAGIYRHLGIADAPIAATLADYAGLAVAVASDRQRRERLRAELLRKGAALYRDAASVRELEAFFEQAVSAAAEGRKLEGWRSSP
jgi:predicted O-linked N-acetylglucosamine transferase (SPINDLY family)